MTVPAFRERITAWANLPEHAMRRGRIAHYFSVVSARTAVRATEELLVQVRARLTAAIEMYLAWVDMLESNEIGRDKTARWLVEAEADGLREVRYLLLDPPAAQTSGDMEFEDDPLHPELAELTLGERKARARMAGVRDFDKFYNEKHPQVIEILFAHPKMSETHVVRFLARRPQPPAAVRALFRVPKWLLAAGPRMAVASNPFTPPRVALRLLPLLNPEELREVASAQGLHADVRSYAAALLRIGDYADLALSAGVGFTVPDRD